MPASPPKKESRVLKLLIGNKNYSSWSLRPWILLRHFDIPFEELYISLNAANFADVVGRYNPALRVPVLIDGELAIWESIAICEYIAERFPQHAIWPRDARWRAQARVVSAEMHAGFAALRNHWPMNIRAILPGHGPEGQVKRDFERIAAIWHLALAESGGPFLFGEFSAADAMYAPVVTRFATYQVDLDFELQRYCDTVLGTPAMIQWSEAARAESEVLNDEGHEPYASPIPALRQA